ncbi:NB-ARC domain-containing protein [Trichocoleus sp. DQ-A3]|uniref:NB-ARC domain-containing protein n=1 Tax=Cyanophyceae TaxID=3028117 RepID=UPI0016832127|nr:NB-ARC domain-containing protein [Coleofasciculus sp. FACHB-125]MBD1902055.1 NACHT domain-containing protein [Coleofasciculus sp. FACHB-125]
MNIETELDRVDAFVFAKTGKHLINSKLQRGILRGAWQGQPYEKIAESCPCNLSHAKEVGSKMWKLISNALAQPVNKDSFKERLEQAWRAEERGEISSSEISVADMLQQSPLDPIFVGRKRQVANPSKIWGEAPDISVFFGRKDELTTLVQWIVKDRCRLVAISGMGGIGKSSLARKLADKIQDEFEYLIWRSLKYAPSVNEILPDSIQFLSHQQKTEADLPEKVSGRVLGLIECLQKHRCLLILDSAEFILQEGERAGRYRKEYEEYGELLTRVGETNHQSCLVLIGWEQPVEIERLVREKLPIRSLLLKGLQEEAAKEILKAKDLAEPDQWGGLIKRYGNNPLALELVSTTIKEFFLGRVSEFLRQNSIFFNNDLSELLEQQFYRLTELEKEIIYTLASECKPISLIQLQQNIFSPVSLSNLVAAIESLKRRSLIEKAEVHEVFFTLQTVVMNYIQKQLIAEFFQDIRQLMQNKSIETTNFVIKYDFTKEPKNNIINTVKLQLLRNYKGLAICQKINEVLSNLREKSSRELGYAEKNLENLLVEIESNLNKP